MTTNPTWGGHRTPGPGRKLGRPAKMAEPVRVTITIETSDLDWLQETYGNASEGARQIIKQAREGEE